MPDGEYRLPHRVVCLSRLAECPLDGQRRPSCGNVQELVRRSHEGSEIHCLLRAPNQHVGASTISAGRPRVATKWWPAVSLIDFHLARSPNVNGSLA
jgi:hypothetical protein